MRDLRPIDIPAIRDAAKRMAALFDTLADPVLSPFAAEALASPARIVEYVERYRQLEHENGALRSQFAELVAARAVGSDGKERADGGTALFEQFKKIEQQVFRAIVTSVAQQVTDESGHDVPGESQRAIRYEVMELLADKLLLVPFRSLMDEVSPHDQLTKTTGVIVQAILHRSALDPKNDDPLVTELGAFVERQLAELVANGLAFLRSRGSIEASRLDSLAKDAVDVIRDRYRISPQSVLLDALGRAADKCVDLAYQLSRSSVACLLWLPERGMPFNWEAHRAEVGTSQHGKIKVALFPGLTIGSRVVEKALVIADGERDSR